MKVETTTGDSKVFTVPSTDDAERFKFLLGDISGRNKARLAGGDTPSTETTAPPTSVAPQPQDSEPPSSYNRITNHQKKRLNKNELKAAVLMRSPELARLHADLVRSGYITEAEFWEGREVIAVSLCLNCF